MNLDKINIVLRDRQPWEAMDLGIQIMRSSWSVLFIPWLILIAIFLALSLSLQLNGYYFTGFFVLWLFKPVYDSLVLHVVSHNIFGERLSVRDIYRSYRKWLKTGFITSLLWWRLSPTRSFNLAVHQLEGLTGAARRKRLGILKKSKNSHAIGLTVLALHFEMLINLTLYASVFMIVPQQYSGDIWNVISDDSQISGVVMNSLFYCLTIFFLEPFYVASGFSLYLNRRTQLEGWDIELAFRKLEQRISSGKALSGSI